jgi:hypothetical protein
VRKYNSPPEETDGRKDTKLMAVSKINKKKL